MPSPIKPLILLMCSCMFFIACKSIRGKSESDLENFTDYQSVETWIKENYEPETITPDSSLFKKIEYYTNDDNGYLIIYPHSEKTHTLIYQNINQNLWIALKNADSKGKFYNEEIHSNPAFTLELKN